MAGAHQLAAVAGLRRQPLGIGRAVPLLDEALAVLFKRRRQRAHRLLQCRVVPLADANGQDETRAIRPPRPRSRSSSPIYRNIAVGRRAELPIHAEVVHQVAPAVAGAHKAAAHPRKPAAGAHRQRPLVLPRQQHLAPGNVHRPRRVARAAAVQVRRQQRIDLEPRQQFLMPLKPHPLQHHRVVRVADDLLGQAVAPLGIAVHIAHPQRLRVNVLEGCEQVALFFVGKRLPVGDQELHVAHLGAVDGGVVDLVQNSVRAGKPDAARSRIGRAHRVFHARSPARLKAGRAKCLALLVKPAIKRLDRSWSLPVRWERGNQCCSDSVLLRSMFS